MLSISYHFGCFWRSAMAMFAKYGIYAAILILGYVLYIHPRLMRILEQRKGTGQTEVGKGGAKVVHVPVEGPGSKKKE